MLGSSRGSGVMAMACLRSALSRDIRIPSTALKIRFASSSSTSTNAKPIPRSAPRSRPIPPPSAPPSGAAVESPSTSRSSTSSSNTPPHPKPITHSIPASTSARPSASSARHPSLRAPWPWRPCSPLISPTPPTGFQEEERLIYARPYEGPFGSRVKMIWMMFPIMGVIVFGYISTPKPRRRGEVVDGGGGEGKMSSAKGQAGAGQEKEGAGAGAGMGDGKTNDKSEWILDDRAWYARPWNWTMIFAATLLMTTMTFGPTRLVTRLSLVRRSPVSTSTPTSTSTSKSLASSSAAQSQAQPGVIEFLRMQHGGHLMYLTAKAPMRDVPLGDVSVKGIGRPGQTSYISLSIKPDVHPNTSHLQQLFSLDRFSYRLDFRDTKTVKNAGDDEEVVLSLNRLEHVFGTLR